MSAIDFDEALSRLVFTVERLTTATAAVLEVLLAKDVITEDEYNRAHAKVERALKQALVQKEA